MHNPPDKFVLLNYHYCLHAYLRGQWSCAIMYACSAAYVFVQQSVVCCCFFTLGSSGLQEHCYQGIAV